MKNRKWLFLFIAVILVLCIPVALSSELYTVTITLADKTVTYSAAEVQIGTAQVAGVAEGQTDPTGAVTYTYYTDSSCTQPFTGIPKNVGTYYVKAYMAADANYYSAESSMASLTILKAAPTLTLADTTVTYNAAPDGIAAVLHGASDSDKPTGAVTYTYTDSHGQPLPGAPTNVGTYTVRASLAADQNYETAQSSPAALTITQAAPTLTLDNTTVTYNGTPASVARNVQGVNDKDVPTGQVTVTYYSDAACAFALPGAPTNAGTYYAKASITAGGNYAAAQSNMATLIIERKPLTAHVVSISDFPDKVYDGTDLVSGEYDISLGGLINGDLLTKGEDYSIFLTYSSANIGTQMIFLNVSLKDTAMAHNYKFDLNPSTPDRLYSTTWSYADITPATPVVTHADITVPYNGLPAYIGPSTVSGVSPTDRSHGQITYTFIDSKGVSSATPPINAGTYAIKAHIDANGNYAAADVNLATLTIEKRVQHASIFTTTGIMGKVYDGTDDSILVGYCNFDNLVLEQTLVKGTDYTITFRYDQASPGDCHIIITIALISNDKTSNYTFPGRTSSISINTEGYIEPATPTITLESVTTTYNGAAVVITPVIKGINDTDVPTGQVIVTYYSDAECQNALPEAPKNAGTYYAKAAIAAAGNYAAAQSNVATLTIERKVLNTYNCVVSTYADKVYDGTNVANATGRFSFDFMVSGEMLAKGVDYTLALTHDTANVGAHQIIYTATVLDTPLTCNYNMIGGNVYKTTIGVTVNITPATPTLDLENTTVTYTGKPAIIAPAVPQGISDADKPTATVTYTYTDSQGNTSSSAPTSAGTYTVKASIAAGGNYTAADNTATLTITPAVPNITLSDVTTLYSGLPVTLTPIIQGVSDTDKPTGTVTYYTDAACQNALQGAPKNSGTYYAKATVAAAGNYTAAQSSVATLTIWRKQLTASNLGIVTHTDKVYDGSNTVSGTGFLEFPQMEPCDVLTRDVDYTVVLTHNTANVGTHQITVTATLLDTPLTRNYDYSDGNVYSSTLQSTAQILPATPVITLNDKTATYSGQAVPIGNATIRGISDTDTPTGAVTYTYTDSLGNTSSSAPTKAGVYTAKVSVAAAGNYTASEKTATLTINPATPTLSLKGKTVTYSGQPVSIDAPTVGGSISDTDKPSGAITYTYTDNQGHSSGTAPANAGTYTVVAHIAAAGNYSAADSNEVTLTIEKRELHFSYESYTGVTKDKVYDGNDINASNACSCEFGNLAEGETLVKDTDYSISLRYSQACVGNCILRATVTLGSTVKAGNYSFSFGANSKAFSSILNAVITPATPALALADTTVTYTSAPASITPAMPNGISPTDVPTGALTYTYTDSQNVLHSGLPKNAGMYTVKASIAPFGNYGTADSNTAKLTITPAAPFLSLSDKMVTYSGQPVSIDIAAVQGINDTDKPDGAVTYTYTDSLGSISASVPTNAGTYTVKASLAANGNYDAAESSPATLTIIPATPTLTLGNKTDAYYGGTIQIDEVQVKGVSGGEVPTGPLVYQYFTDAGLVNQIAGYPKNAGVYYVRALIGSSDNYTLAFSNVATLTIQKKYIPSFNLQLTKAYDKVYDGTDDASGAAVLSSDYLAPDDVLITGVDYTLALRFDSANAGTRAVTLTAALSSTAKASNYTFSTGNSFETTIEDAAQILPAVPILTLASKSAAFTGRPVTIGSAAVTGIAPTDLPKGAITYAYFRDSAMSEPIAAPTEPGVYYAAAYIAAYGNYAAAASPVAKLTILKLEDPAPVQQVLTPTGKTVTLETDTDTDLVLNAKTVEDLVLYESEQPAWFQAEFASLPDNTMALLFALQPDSDTDGNIRLDANGNPAFGPRILNLSTNLVGDLTGSGITNIEVTYGKASFRLNLNELMKLNGFETIEEFHVVIEPVKQGDSVQTDDGVLIITGANGAMFRVKVLAAEKGTEQETPISLDSLAVLPQP